MIFPRSENCLAIGNCTCSQNCRNQYTALKKKHLLPHLWLKFNFQKCMYVSQIWMWRVNTHPQRRFKLGLVNMKTAIITVLQLCRKHNSGSNSDFTSAYTQPWFAATVSMLLLTSGGAGASLGQWSKGPGMLSPATGREWVCFSQGAEPDTCHHRPLDPMLRPASIKEGRAEEPSGKRRNYALHGTSFQSLQITPE